MVLGYRAFFNVDRSADLLHLVDEQAFSWLAQKRWQFDALREGALVDIAPDARGVVLDDSMNDGARTKRYRFIENSAGGVWITELTAHVARDGTSGWVWLEIDQPDDAPRTGTPRLARMLVEVLAVSDGAYPLTPRPLPIGVDDVDRAVGSVLDDARRGLLFLAGSSHQVDIPLPQWTDYVSKILVETIGLSSAYVLDADATSRFNELVPASHQLRGYTIRTYRPGVQLDEPLDAERHRILSTRSIVNDDPRYLRRLLGQRARDVINSGSLPSAVRRIDRRLRDQLDSLLTESPAEVINEQRPVAPGVDTTSPTPVESVQGVLGLVLGQVFGVATVTKEAVRRLGQLALDAKSAIAASRDVKQRLNTLENRIDARDDAIEDLRRRLEDEQLELALSSNELAETERQLRYLRGELAAVGRFDIAWSTPEKSPLDIRPESFDELLQRFHELKNLVFTGDADQTRDLDNHEGLGTWAGRCWNALLALNDYATLSLSGEFSGSVHTYLENTPAGAHDFSANRHAPFESSDVGNKPKYRKPRILPVPVSVDSSGTVYMEAHFKIAKSATVTPRMHYFDDTARSKRIYVGYIGRHLPSSKD